MLKNVYGQFFFDSESRTANIASQIILPYVINKLNCRSVVDFGCGTGEWLYEAKSCKSVNRILGIDGEYAKKYLKINQDEFLAADLTKEVQIDMKFDLALSLEVAEHLPVECSERFIFNLTQAADVVLFGAAVPYQHGTRHINEQYASYWKKIFEKFGFAICDCIRPYFWNDFRIEGFYRQNIFIYYKKQLEEKINNLFANENSIIDCIHPSIWEKRSIIQYLFPFELVNRNDTICIIGGGVVGQTFVNQLLNTNYIKKFCWCDKNAKSFEWKSQVLCDIPENIDMNRMDKIIISVLHEAIALDIKKELLKQGVDEKKILWKDPKYSNIIY